MFDREPLPCLPFDKMADPGSGLGKASRGSGRTMPAIEDEARVSPGMISRFMRGRRDPRPETVQKQASVLGLGPAPLPFRRAKAAKGGV